MVINYLYNLIYQILLIIIPLITIPYLSRVIGAEGLGIFSYTNSIANYFVLFAMLGLNNYGNRTIARVRDDKEKLSKTFWSIYLSQFLISIVIIVLYFIYISDRDLENRTIAIVQMLLVISSVFDINWFFFGIEKFKITVSRNFIIKIITLILIFSLVKDRSDLIIYTIIISGGILVSQLVLWPYLRREVYWVRPTIKEVTSHIKPNLILFIPVISVSIYKMTSKIILGNLTDMVQLGYYDNAEKINSVQISISTALGTVMLPRMSNLISTNNSKQFKDVFRMSMRFVMFLSFALCFGIIAVSQDFVPLFMGDEFAPSSAILMVLAPTGVIISWANVIRTQYLIPLGKDNVYIISVILGALINIVMNILLVKQFGGFGAGIATLVTEGVVMIYQTTKSSDFIDFKLLIKDSYVFMFSGLLMLVFVKLFGHFIDGVVLRLILQIILGAIFYFSSVILYFFFFNRKEYEKYLKKIINR